MTLSAVFWRCAGRILYAERDSYLAPGIVVAAEALVRTKSVPKPKQRSTRELLRAGLGWVAGAGSSALHHALLREPLPHRTQHLPPPDPR